MGKHHLVRSRNWHSSWVARCVTTTTHRVADSTTQLDPRRAGVPQRGLGGCDRGCLGSGRRAVCVPVAAAGCDAFRALRGLCGWVADELAVSSQPTPVRPVGPRICGPSAGVAWLPATGVSGWRSEPTGARLRPRLSASLTRRCTVPRRPGAIGSRPDRLSLGQAALGPRLASLSTLQWNPHIVT